MNRIFLVVLILVCLVIYAGYLNNGFVFDDKILVESNPLIKSAQLLPNIFKTAIFDYWDGSQPYDRMYRPLQMFSYYLDYNLWGLSPSGFRFSNIILHLLNSILVFYLFSLFFNNKLLAASTSILFLVHPVQISTVAYISSRGDLLSAFFILACCILFLKFLSSKSFIYYFLSMLMAIFALLSRENALLIVTLLILISAFSIKNGAKLKYLAGFIACSIIYIITRLIVLGPSGLATHEDYIKGVFSLVNFINIICRYVLLLLWPMDLRMFHSTAFIRHLSTPELLLFFLGLALLLVVIFKWQKVKQMPVVVRFSLSWFLLGIIPVYFYFDAYPALGRALMSESWLYLPSIGFCAFFSYLCLLNKKGKLIISACVIIMATLVVSNKVYWRNDVTFYERALQFLPEDCIILRNLATACVDAGDLPKAHETINKLEKYYSDTPITYIAWGQYYLSQGQANEALKYYQRILKKSFFSNYSISLCYAKLSDFNKAIEFSQTSFNQNPFFQKNIMQLAFLYDKVGQICLANRYLLLAKQLDPRGSYFLTK